MDDEFEQEIQKAEKRLWYDPWEDKYTIRQGMKHLYFRHIYNIIDLFEFDLDEKKVTKGYVANNASAFIIELAEETHGKGETIVGAFEDQKGEFLGEIFGGSMKTYQLAFPLNLCQGSYPKDQLSDEIKKLDYNDWKGDYYDPALDQDDTHFEKFLDESPNDIIIPGGRSPKFTYWITEYEARDPNYALNKVIQFLRVTLGKINYTLHKKNTDRTTGSNNPPVG